jgi:hypothetical protein
VRRHAQPKAARATRRVLLTRVKRESLGKYEAEPALEGQFTLHDASLGGIWAFSPNKSTTRVRERTAESGAGQRREGQSALFRHFFSGLILAALPGNAGVD